MALSSVIWVALGGALGAVARYSVVSATSTLVSGAFPTGTLLVNVLGALILGFLVEVFALIWSPGAEVQAFLVVGVLGGFTTFSMFSLDVVYLLERGDISTAMIYVLLSVILSVSALWIGMLLGRFAFS